MRVGDGLLAIWNDIVIGEEAAFVEWHSREHMPERLSIPGFLRGRRLYASGAKPRWVTLYEAGSAEVFQSPAYLARLAEPTPGTRAVLPTFRATERMIGTVVATAGAGSGGALAVLRVWGSGHSVESLAALACSVANTSPALSCAVARSVGASQATEEQRLRGGDLDPPDLVVMTELYVRGSDGWKVPLLLKDFGVECARRQFDVYGVETVLRSQSDGRG